MSYHRIPRSLLQDAPPPTDQEVELKLLSGDHVPEAVASHSGCWFTVAPTAPADAPPVPCVNGDGVVYRVTLNGGRLTARAAWVDEPSRRVELRLKAKPHPKVAPFGNLGVARISVGRGKDQDRVHGLGVRNFANTALVPVEIGGQVRLLVTYDAGRPMWVDPGTLKTWKKPLGAPGDWRAALFGNRPFPFLGTTAHPAWDGSGTLYLANFARDLRRLADELGTVSQGELALLGEDAEAEHRYPLFYWEKYGKWWGKAAKGHEMDRYSFGTSRDKSFVALVPTQEAGNRPVPILPADLFRKLVEPQRPRGTLLTTLLDYTRTMFEEMTDQEPFAHLVRWRMEGGVELIRHFQLRPARDRAEHPPAGLVAGSMDSPMEVVDLSDLLAGGGAHDVNLHARAERGINVRGSVHQLGITENYILFADTSFKFDFDIIAPESGPIDPLFSYEELDLLRRFMTVPTAPLRMWLVRRKDVEVDPQPGLSHGDGSPQKPWWVPALEVALPPALSDHAVIHFVVDHADDHGTKVRMMWITHHATDPAEFIHASDVDADGRRFGKRAGEQGDPAQGPGWDREKLIGFFSAGYDPNAVVAVDIKVDPQKKTAEVSGFAQVADDRTWMLGLPTGPGMMDDPTASTPSFREWYVSSLGLSPEVVTGITWRMYRTHRGRQVGNKGEAAWSLEDIKEKLREGGIPGGFLRVVRSDDEQGPQLRIAGYHGGEPGMVFAAPQYLRSTRDGQPPLVAVAVFRAGPTGDQEKEREIWIFEASESGMSRGPLARYDATGVGWRMPFHTAWLPLRAAAQPDPPPLFESITLPTNADEAWEFVRDAWVPEE